MSTEREELPSFLSPVRRFVQPTLLDLERYYPERHFWKFALLEQYTVNDEELEELQIKGWQQISDYQQHSMLLSLTSQLSLVLALKSRKKKKEQVQLWARITDIEHATQYPVVLTHSSLQDSLTEAQVPVGTHAIIFDDLSSTVFCYDLDQLGKEGKEYWQRIAMGLQPPSLQQTYTIEEKIASHALLFVQAQEAALRLSQLYWLLHEQKQQVPIPPSRTLPLPHNILHHGGMIIPQLDPVEGVLLALSHAQKERGWEEVNAIPTYIHQRPSSTTEVTVRPRNDTQLVPGDITNQLWQRVRQFNDVDGDIFLAMLAQFLGSPPDAGGGTWITAQQILEYRGIQPKLHKRDHPISKEEAYRNAGYRMNDLRDVAGGVDRIRDTHITVRTWKESHKRTKVSSKPARKRVYHHESYLITITDFVQQSKLLLEEEQPSPDENIVVSWYYRPGTCLDVFLTGPNYRAAWLLQQALRYDPYHEQWEKRLARYFIFQMRMNAELGGTTIRRTIGTLIEELALSLNTEDPSKIKKRFEKAMSRLEFDGIISGWGPQDRYEQAMKLRPRYNWLGSWLAYEIEIVAEPLPQEQAQSMLGHLQSRRHRKTLLPDRNEEARDFFSE